MKHFESQKKKKEIEIKSYPVNIWENESILREAYDEICEKYDKNFSLVMLFNYFRLS